MRAKVVILNWNGEAMMELFLPSVVAATPPGVEVVVADNGSMDGSVAMLAAKFPSVRVVRLDRNWGYAEGYNRAIELLEKEDAEEGNSLAECYILLNSDVRTPAGWYEPLIEILATHPDVAAVAPKLLASENPGMFEYAGASGGFIDALGYPFCRGRILRRVEADRGQYDDARDVFWATGACFACRADVFRDLGGFDASFFAHQEEIDLSWRMQLAGWRVVVEPRSTVYHLGAGTLPTSPRKVYYNHRNNLAMLYKNLPDRRLRGVMAMRWVLDRLSAAVYLMKGERDYFEAVRRAIRDFEAMKKGVFENGNPEANNPEESLRTKRRCIQAASKGSPRGIYRGSIVIRYMMGWRRFGGLKIF